MRQTMKNLWQAITENRSAVNGELKPPARAYSGSNGYIVYLTYGSQDDRSTITFGVHSDYAKAIQLAFEARPQHTPILSLKLDVVTRIRERSVPTTFQQQDERISFKPGRDGIILDDRPDMLFIPEEIQAYQILKRGRVNESGLRHALSYRPQTAAMESSIKTPANVRVIRTTSYYIDSSGYYSLSNGQRKGFPLSEEKLEYAVKLASSNYFKHAVDANGRITYAYHPHTDSEADGYNILRHAGTAYSMLELYEWNRDQDILDAAARALEYLTSFSHEHTINGIAVNVIVEEDLIKLGGNGLAIVACAKYTQVTGDRKYVPFMQSLATWMEELQRDAPRFSIHKQKYSTGKVWDFESRYYPGEAILAMVRLYETDGDSRWLDYAEKETRYLIEVRDREADKATIPHDHWLLYGIYNLYQYRPLAIYRSHAFFIADAITESQFTDPDEVSREMLGYFHMDNPRPRSTPAACRSEGLGAASRLADQVKDRDRARRYRRSIHQAISFQLQMQLYPESVLYFPNKSLSLGAFRGNLRNWELRNDYTQHNISSILSYLRFVKAMSTTEKSSLQLIQTSFDAEKYPVYLRRSNRRVFLACIRRGADWTRLDGGRFELKKGRYTYTIEDGKVLDALNSPLAVRCIKRKEVTTGLLRSRELPAPENALFYKGDLERAWDWAQKLLPVVVKPGGGSKGRSVSVNLSTFSEFETAFQQALDTDPDVLVEQHIDGEIYRFTCLDGNVIAVGRRRRLHVRGDGSSTIQKLLEQKNEERRRRKVLGHSEINVTPALEASLRLDGFDLHSIPAKEKVVFLSPVSHVSAGGEAIDATDEVSQVVKRMVEEAVQSIPGLGMCGVDVIIDDDGQPHILEINNDPNITTHMEPWEGKAIPVAKMIAKAMFPE